MGDDDGVGFRPSCPLSAPSQLRLLVARFCCCLELEQDGEFPTSPRRRTCKGKQNNIHTQMYSNTNSYSNNHTAYPV